MKWILKLTFKSIVTEKLNHIYLYLYINQMIIKLRNINMIQRMGCLGESKTRYKIRTLEEIGCIWKKK
jgi:hypothetical protein